MATPPVYITPLCTTSFTAALWIVGQGFEPLSVTANPAGGGELFTFPAEARAVWAAYTRTKDRLMQLRRDAK